MMAVMRERMSTFWSCSIDLESETAYRVDGTMSEALAMTMSEAIMPVTWLLNLRTSLLQPPAKKQVPRIWERI